MSERKPERITLELAKAAFREQNLTPDSSLYYLDLSPDPYPCRACLVGALAVHLAGTIPDEDGEIYEDVIYDGLETFGYHADYVAGLDAGFSNPSSSALSHRHYDSDDWWQGVGDSRAVRRALLEGKLTHDDE